MNTRYNFKWTAPKVVESPIKEEFELITLIEPISFNDDKTIKEYKEVQKYVVKKSKWNEFIESYDLGSPNEQLMNHFTKGTPLITSHTLPAGDYTPKSLLKGAEIVREMQAKGITLEMLESAYNEAKSQNAEASASEGGAE